MADSVVNAAAMEKAHESYRARLFFSFFAVYVLWGTTFLAIRIAVGAGTSSILRLVLGEGLATTAVGVMLGVVTPVLIVITVRGDRVTPARAAPPPFDLTLSVPERVPE